MILPAGLMLVQSIAFVHVTVIDVQNGSLRPDQAVVVTGNRIAQLGPAAATPIPRGARAIDATGQFLIPGLWDMHVHAAWPRQLPTFGPLFLANGVTGVREMWGNLSLVKRARTRLQHHALTAPRFVASGAILDGSPPFWPTSTAVTSAAQAVRVVDSLHDAGADFIKVYSFLARDVYLAIMSEAQHRHMPVAGHVPLTVGAWLASQSGQRSIEHLTDYPLSCSTEEDTLRAELQAAAVQGRDALLAVSRRQRALVLESFSLEKCRRLAAEFKRHGTWQVPTLTVLRSTASLDDTTRASDPRLAYMAPETRESWLARNDFRFRTMGPEDFARARRLFASQLSWVGVLHDAQVPLLAGTDTPNPYCFPGFSLHDELALLVEAGLTPLEALRTATLNPAEFLGAMDSLGTIAPGKLADLVLLNGNPLADIHNTQAIDAVMLDGRLIDRAAREQILADVRAQFAGRR